MTKRKTHEEFINEFYVLCDSIEVLGTYKTTETPIKCKCKTCNHIWYPTPNKLLHGRRCPVCANQQRGIHITQNEFSKQLEEKNPLVTLIGVFSSGHDTTRFKCKKCGNEWDAKPYSVLAGHGCPICAHTATSFSEKFIAKSLAYVLGDSEVTTRSKKLIGKELDIHVPAYNIAIEFNGWFWHKNKINNDKEKATLCKNANCTLISIYDACPLSALPLDNDYYVFEKDLGVDPECKALKDLVILLLQTYFGIAKSMEDFDWNTIISSSMFEARKKSTEEFRKEFYNLCDTIEILGEYKKSNVAIQCRCKTCNYEWFPTPNGLLRGLRCPNCSGVRRKSHKEFLDMLYANNDSYRNSELEVLGKYRSSSYKIKIKCLKCNRVWEARPSDLLRGHGCGCTSKSHSRLIVGINDLKTTNNELCLDWDYQKNKKDPSEYRASNRDVVSWRCHVCGYEWNSTILSRVRGNCKCRKCNPTQRNKDPISAEKRQRKLVEEKGSLSKNNPLLASLWNYDKNTNLTPDDVTASSGRRVWWCCPQGHEWQSTIANMKIRPYCSVCHNPQSTRLVLQGINDLATKNPELVKEWDYSKNKDINPNSISSGSHKKVWWLCKNCGYSWMAVVSDRNRGHGCPECSREKNRKSLFKRVKNIDTGIVYKSAAEASRMTGLTKYSIAECCRKNKKTCGGYRWEYCD